MSFRAPRHWTGRAKGRLALCAAAATILFLLQTERAHAGAYEVVECYPSLNGGAPDAQWDSSDSAYTGGLDCSRGDGWGAYTRLTVARANEGTSAAWHFYAPAGTVFRSGSFYYRNWSANGASGNVALYGPAGSAQSWGPSDERQVSFGPSQGNHLVAGLYCSNGGGCLGDASSYGYGQGYWNLVQIRYLHLELLDTADPELALSGSITEGGYRNGTESLDIAASDQGGGPRGAAVSVNGQRVADLDNTACSFVAGGYAERFVPCPPRIFTTQLATDQPPFVDGENSLEVCVHDVAMAADSPRRSCEERTVLAGDPPPSDLDTDGDGCTDAAESAMGTDPTDPDTDDDGIGDCQETAAHSCLSPTNQDSDSDGQLDGVDPEPCRGATPAAGAVAGEHSGIPTFSDCAVRTVGSQRRDRLSGSKADDRILGRGGSDKIRDMGGRNCLLGNRGNDRVRGGPEPDRLVGGPGQDMIAARDGVRDLVKCGAGRVDRARVDRIDLVTGCERLGFRR